MGYSDQHLSQLDDADTPMTAVAGQFDVGDQRARGLLAGAGINIQMQDTKIWCFVRRPEGAAWRC